MILEKKRGSLELLILFDSSAEARRLGSMIHWGRKLAADGHARSMMPTDNFTAMVEFPLLGQPRLELPNVHHAVMLIALLSIAVESSNEAYTQDRLSEEESCEMHLAFKVIFSLSRANTAARPYINRQLDRLSKGEA